MAGPAASSAEALKRMRRQRRRDTEPELTLRRELHRLGLRYRVDHPVLPGVRRRADVAFGPARVAVFVDGCFWHMCPDHRSLPRANAAWWQEKLEGNVARDRDSDLRLGNAGWLSLHIWEHQDMAEAARAVAEAVLMRRRG